MSFWNLGKGLNPKPSLLIGEHKLDKSEVKLLEQFGTTEKVYHLPHASWYY